MNMQSPGTASTLARFLMDEWGDAIARSLQSMTDVRPEVTWQTDEKAVVPTESSSEDQGLNLEISLSLFSAPSVWIFLPGETCRELGLLALRAAGIDMKNALELGPGNYVVRVVVRDNVTGKIGSVTAPLTVN